MVGRDADPVTPPTPAPGLRVFAADVGTNTVDVLVADLDGDALRVVADAEWVVRLGEGVDASRRLAGAAIDRVTAALTEAWATMGAGVDRVCIGVTSAGRDASNTADLLDAVDAAIGVRPRVVPGPEEAALAHRGALALRPDLAAALVIDLGGGSTELALGDRHALGARVSLDVGTVRLRERHVDALPVSRAAARAVVDDVRAAFAAQPVARGGAPVVIGGAVARIVARCTGVDGPVETAAVEAWAARLGALSRAEVLAVDPALMAGRADVAAVALLIVATLLRELGADRYEPTRGGLRHGLALTAGRDA